MIDSTELRTPHLRGWSDGGVRSDCEVGIVYPLVANIRHFLLQLPHHLRHDVCVIRLVEDIKELKGVLLGIEKLPLLFFAAEGGTWEAKAFVVPGF